MKADGSKNTQWAWISPLALKSCKNLARRPGPRAYLCKSCKYDLTNAVMYRKKAYKRPCPLRCFVPQGRLWTFLILSSARLSKSSQQGGRSILHLLHRPSQRLQRALVAQLHRAVAQVHQPCDLGQGLVVVIAKHDDVPGLVRQLRKRRGQLLQGLTA